MTSEGFQKGKKGEFKGGYIIQVIKELNLMIVIGSLP
jgi:hypothetical protein